MSVWERCGCVKGNELLGALSCCSSPSVVPKALLVSLTHLPCDFCQSPSQEVPREFRESVPAPLSPCCRALRDLEFHWGTTAPAGRRGKSCPKTQESVPDPCPTLLSSYHTKLISHEKQSWKGLWAVTAGTSEQGEENVYHCWKQSGICIGWLLVLMSLLNLFPFPSPWLHSPHWLDSFLFCNLWTLWPCWGKKKSTTRAGFFFPADHRLLCLCSSVRGFSQSSVHSSGLCYWHTDKNK